jgi:uncharacterized protein YjiS (DUF1127 family)
MDEAFNLSAEPSHSRLTVRRIVPALLRLFRRWRVRARRRDELAGLSPYLLDDIGITAADVQRESERQPWEAPLLKSSKATPTRED